MQSIGHVSAFLPILLVVGFYSVIAIVACRALQFFLRPLGSRDRMRFGRHRDY